MTDTSTLLQVENLVTHFDTDDGLVQAVRGVSFSLDKGRTLGVVGESGSGKSVAALSITRLLPRPKARIVEGRVRYVSPNGPVDLTELDPAGAEIRAIRGNDIAMIFQEPMTSLNPVFTVGAQIVEAIRLHHDVGKREARERAAAMLDKVGIPNPSQRIKEYPHQFSGGMRQRAMIAMALSCNPRILISDEPTTALDVTIAAQILTLIRDLQDEFGMSVLIITHDLGVIGEVADEVVVMYAGQIVERASTVKLFYEPKHPYAQGLLRSTPKIGVRKRLTPIAGVVPSMSRIPKGCAFAARCSEAMNICRQQDPPEFDLGGGHGVRCWLHQDAGAAQATATTSQSDSTQTHKGAD